FDLNQFFFFSSRRRHTSFSRDWSSDVCSSDLSLKRRHQLARGINLDRQPPIGRGGDTVGQALGADTQTREILRPGRDHAPGLLRSEERRVGKECRGRWAWEQLNEVVNLYESSC